MSSALKVYTNDYSSLVGLPYEAFNCWQIVREFYWIVFQVHLNHYFEKVPDTKTDIRNLIYSNIGDFCEVDGELQFGDLILIRIHGIESHIAVYVGNGYLFHSSKRTGSVLDRLDRWRPHVTGFYRLKVA